jgi:predicted nucleic acid-binding Zn ribbon protein
MSNCFLCGRPLKPGSRHQRRKVKTGEWARRRYPGGPASSVTVRFGLRVVCGRCARVLNGEERRKEAAQYVELAVAVLVLLVGLVAQALR